MYRVNFAKQSFDQPQIPLSSISTYYDSGISWQSEYRSFDQKSSLLNRYQYFISMSSDWSFQHWGNIRETKNERFDRSSYHHDFLWSVSKTEHISENIDVTYSLTFNQDKSTDEAKPDFESYEVSRKNNSAGLSFNFSLTDTLSILSNLDYIKSNEYNSQHYDKNVDSDGYRLNSKLTFSRNFPGTSIELSSYFDQLTIDYDYHRNYGFKSNVTLTNRRINTLLAFDKQTRNIFLLDNKIDTHTRTNYRTSLSSAATIADGMEIYFINRYNARDNKLKYNSSRNYLDMENQAKIHSNYNIWRLRFFNSGEYNIFSRSFFDDQSSREQSQNIFHTGISYQHSLTDSLVVSQRFALTRTDYTILSNRLDNDELIDETQVSAYLKLNPSINLINHFYYTRRHEVYLQSSMSGNNKITRTYHLLPSLDIEISNYLRLRQDYHLRADYDDYSWDGFHNDRMYRKFSASYAILSHLPLGIDSISYFDNNIPYYFNGNNYENYLEYGNFHNRQSIIINLRYTYDTNDSGFLVNDKYDIYASNVYHTYELELMRKFSRIDLIVTPRYVRTNDTYEFNHKLGLNYYLPGETGFSSLLLNPRGKSIDDITWRVDFSINYEW